MKMGSGILAVFAVVFCMLFSLWKETAVPVRAADGTFQKVTLSLNSNASDGASIDLYLRDSVHYIAIDDLCTLARCSRSADGGLISVAQGIRRVEFDPGQQRFTDGCQEGELLIPEVADGEYAVPALLFLNYFKAAAFIKDGTLYCRMPRFTAWEALDTERNEDREAGIRSLYEDLHSEKGKAFTRALGETFSIPEEPEEWYIRFYFNMLEEPFVALAYGGRAADLSGGDGKEDSPVLKRSGTGLYEAFVRKNQTEPEDADRRLLLAAAAAETAQLMKTIKAADAWISEKDGTPGIGALQLERKTREFFTGDACREMLASADVSGPEEICGSLEAYLEEAARWFEEEFALPASGVKVLREELSIPELGALCEQSERRAQELLAELQEDGTADCLPLDAASFPAQPERPCVNLYPVWEEYLRASGEEEAYFLPADYDGDGRKEAFGFTGTFDGQKGYDGVKIYYISAVGEVECVRSRTEYGEPLYGYLLTQPAGGTEEGENYFLSASGQRFLVWEISAYGSGSSSVILGVKDGKAYEPSISEQYMTFQQTGPAEFTGLVSDFSEGGHAYREQRFAYEKSAGEFEPAGGETGNDEEKKTAVNKERKQP